MPFEDNASSELSYGLEISEGVRGTAETFLQYASETLTEERPPEINPNLDFSNLETEPRSLVARGAGTVKMAPDVASILKMRVQHRGYFVKSTLAAAVVGPPALPAVYQWLVRNKERADAALAAYAGSMFFTAQRGDGLPKLILGAKGTVATWKITEGKFVDFEQALLFPRITELGDPVADAANNVAFTGKVYVRGMRSDPTATAPLYIEVTTPGALDGTAKFKAKIGGAAHGAVGYLAEFTGPEIAIVDGAWTQVLVALSADPGDPSAYEPVEVMFAKALVGDVMTVLDTFTVENTRTMAAASYSTARSLTAVGATAFATIGGVQKEYAIHDATITYTVPRKLNGGIGRKYAFGVIPDPTQKESCTITLARDYTDLDFYRALVHGTEAAFSIPMFGDLIRVGYREKWQLDIAHARVTGAGAARAWLPETVTARAFRPAGGTDPLLLETIVNTVAAL